MTPDAFVDFLGTERASAILRTDVAEAAAPAMDAAVEEALQDFVTTRKNAMDDMWY